MIKYIGSKRKLIDQLLSTIKSCRGKSVVDLFSGTSRVGYALKKAGYRVLANDHNNYAYIIAKAYIETSIEDVDQSKLQKLIKHLNNLKGEDGFFTETYCKNAMFFRPKNGQKIDAIRNEIEALDLSNNERAVLLVSLIEAADRVDSTVGLQMAYLKQWSKRSYNDLELKMPNLLPRAIHGDGSAHKLDARVAASSLKADIFYLDPPYNQHSYLGNYHIWETLVLWDKPEVYGKAMKRKDVKKRKSPFNSKRLAVTELSEVIKRIDAKTIIVSFNNEGYVSKDEIENILKDWAGPGQVLTQQLGHKRHVCSQIGIYDLSGKKRGTPGKKQNIEYIFTAIKL